MAVNRYGRALAELGEARNYLSFRVGEEHYAIELRKVRELLGGAQIVRNVQPNARTCGFVNLRSKQVPVIDLRSRFGVQRAPTSAVSIVVQVDDGADTSIALVIDELLEVRAIAASTIAPEYPPIVSSIFVRGAVPGVKRPIYMLALERVLDLPWR